MQKLRTKKYSIDGQGMADVELVAIMDDALRKKNNYNIKYVVRVNNSRWDVNYKIAWAEHINTIDHWKPLSYKYNKRTDNFEFFKRRKRHGSNSIT